MLHRILPSSVYRRHIARHEDTSIALWKELAKEVPAGHAVLDIGAFHGEFSVAAKESVAGLNVFAFEPDPSNLAVLKRTCASIGVEVVEAAVAETPGTVRFSRASAQSRIMDETHSKEEEGNVVVAVSLDSWSASHNVRLALIKLDTEGCEAAILRGSRRVLSDCRPAIICEVLSDSAGLAVMEALPSCYQYWFIDEDRALCLRRSVVERRTWRNKNWLFLPAGVSPPVLRRGKASAHTPLSQAQQV